MLDESAKQAAPDAASSGGPAPLPGGQPGRELSADMFRRTADGRRAIAEAFCRIGAAHTKRGHTVCDPEGHVSVAGVQKKLADKGVSPVGLRELSGQAGAMMEGVHAGVNAAAYSLEVFNELDRAVGDFGTYCHLLRKVAEVFQEGGSATKKAKVLPC